MLRLELGARCAEWIDLGHGVELECQPLTTLVMYSARRSHLVTDLPDDASNEHVTLALARAVARAVVTDWRGVGDAEGKPLPVTPEGLDALLDLVEMCDAFLTRYLHRGLVLEREKNAFALSPSGTSTGATSTARGAESAARRARLTKTNPKRSKAPKSGR